MWDANRRIRLQDDSRAITTIIGTMFVFSFIVILLSVNQAQVVPQQNSEVEFQHFQDVRSDMVKVRTAILTASRTDTVQYTTVSLGTTYPSRVIAMNPPPPTGTLRTTEKHNIIIQGETRKEIRTRFIEYRPGYNELNVGPIRYENSVLYLDQREGSGGVAIIEEQNIVTNNGNKARIPVIKKEYSESSVGRVAIRIQPVGEETKTVGVVPDDQGNVSISIPTRLSGDYWNRSDVPVDGFVSSSDGINRVNITRSIDSVEFNTVGADSAPDGIDIEAEVKGNPPVENATGGPLAYRDRDNDLQYDDGETTYTKDELKDFDKNVNLAIPPDVGTISGGGISIEADNITSRANYQTDSNGVEFSTGNSDGVIDLATSTIDSSSKKTDIIQASSGTEVILDQTDIGNKGLNISASNVSAINATITTGNKGVTLSDIDGTADLTNATIDSSSKKTDIIQASSGTEVILDQTDIGNKGLNISASNVSAINTTITTGSKGVTLSDIDGTADLTGATISSSSKKTDIIQASSGTEVILDQADIGNKGLNISASNVSAINATITTGNKGVTLSDIDGTADLTNATISSSSKKTDIIQASSGTEVILDQADIGNKGLNISASNVSAINTTITTGSKGVTLSDIDGTADLTGATISSSSKKTDIIQASSGAEVILDQTDIGNKGLNISASNVSAINTTITTGSKGVTLSDIDGTADLTNATISSSSKKTDIIQASSGTEVILDQADIGNKGLNISASNVSAINTTITTGSKGVTLSDIDGTADLTGATISSSSKKTKITQASSSNTKVVAQNADVSSPGLDIIAGEISAKSIAVSTNSNGIDLTSESGLVKLSKSNLTTSSTIIIDSEDKITAKGINTDSSGKIQLCAEEDINIADGNGQESKIKTEGTADADFSSGSDIFTVEGVEITTNNDNKMTYSPSGVTVNNNGDGTNSTESGKVVQTNSGQSSLC